MAELNATTLLADANLKAYYRFESGALTTDSSGEGHTLTAISDPAEDASGKYGGSVALDGDDAYSAVDHADFKPTTGFTVGGWLKGTTANGYIFQSFSTNTNIAGLRLWVDANKKIRLDSGKNTGTVAGTDYQAIVSTSVVADDTWKFVAGVWDGSYLRIYVNGVANGTAVAWANAPGFAATNYVRVGSRNLAGTNQAFFTGSVDDIFFFDRALSADEILYLYGEHLTQNIADTISLADVLGNAPTKALADAMSLADNLSRTVAFSRDISDSVSLADSSSRSSGKALEDTISLADSMAKSVGTQASDTVSLADTIVNNVGKNLSDSISLADDMTYLHGTPNAERAKISVRKDQAKASIRNDRAKIGTDGESLNTLGTIGFLETVLGELFITHDGFNLTYNTR